MTDKETRLTRLEAIASEIQDLANSFAGDVTCTAAAELHVAANKVHNAMRMIRTGSTPEDETKMWAEWFLNHPEFIGLFSKDEKSS